MQNMHPLQGVIPDEQFRKERNPPRRTPVLVQALFEGLASRTHCGTRSQPTTSSRRTLERLGQVGEQRLEEGECSTQSSTSGLIRYAGAGSGRGRAHSVLMLK